MSKTMIIKNDNIFTGTLLLVNGQYPLKNSDTEGLAALDARFPGILMKKEAVVALGLALKDIMAGDSIIPVSGYRSMEEQSEIYQESLIENGEEFTRKFVALPNHSEHQTGLAIDLRSNKEAVGSSDRQQPLYNSSVESRPMTDMDFICPDFPYEGICDRFRKVAPDYGFIQRYGEDKEEITGIAHEPWHFRYVGLPHSKIIEEKGLALEEYMEFIKDYRKDSRYVYRQMAMPGAKPRPIYEVYYVPVDMSMGRTLLAVPESGSFEISGNNMDGFIVAVWREKDGEK